MSDELDLELDSDLDENEEKKRNERALKRNRDLSEKLKMEAEAREKAEAERANALKDAEFYKNFSSLSSKYQSASDFQDKIREKVMAGYDVEDAMVSVLQREGKLTPQAEAVQVESPAGGSATNTIRSEPDKGINEMSREEKRAKLMENEGALVDLLSPKIGR